jgi:XapX domain-containing protein
MWELALLKPYLISLGAGLLVGIVYSVLHVRSPAPPVIALIGLFGMLIGEQIVPLAGRYLFNTSASIDSSSDRQE